MKTEKTYGVSDLQRILNRDHRRLKSWHLVAQDYGVNVGYIYRLAKHGIEPINPSIRQALGLPHKCPTCKRKVKSSVITVRTLADYPVELLKYMILNREEF